jgi:hypothetical protein
MFRLFSNAVQTVDLSDIQNEPLINEIMLILPRSLSGIVLREYKLTLQIKQFPQLKSLEITEEVSTQYSSQLFSMISTHLSKLKFLTLTLPLLPI